MKINIISVIENEYLFIFKKTSCLLETNIRFLLLYINGFGNIHDYLQALITSSIRHRGLSEFCTILACRRRELLRAVRNIALTFSTQDN